MPEFDWQPAAQPAVQPAVQPAHGQYGVVPEFDWQTFFQPSIISGREALANDVLLRVQIPFSCFFIKAQRFMIDAKRTISRARGEDERASVISSAV